MTQTTQAVEATVQRLMQIADQFALYYPEKTGWSAQAQKTDRANLEAALRAALASQQEVAAPVGDAEIIEAVRLTRLDGTIYLTPESLRQAISFLPASRVPVASPAVPADVLKAAISFQKDGYRGPLAWARKVFDWVVETGATPPGGAGGAGVMDARPDSFHSDSGECDRVQGPGPTDAERLNWADQNIFHREMDDWDKGLHPGRSMWVIFSPTGAQGSARNILDAAILAKGGDQGEGK